MPWSVLVPGYCLPDYCVPDCCFPDYRLPRLVRGGVLGCQRLGSGTVPGDHLVRSAQSLRVVGTAEFVHAWIPKVGGTGIRGGTGIGEQASAGKQASVERGGAGAGTGNQQWAVGQSGRMAVALASRTTASQTVASQTTASPIVASGLSLPGLLPPGLSPPRLPPPQIGSGRVDGAGRLDWFWQNGLGRARWIAGSGLVPAEWIGSGQGDRFWQNGLARARWIGSGRMDWFKSNSSSRSIPRPLFFDWPRPLLF